MPTLGELMRARLVEQQQARQGIAAQSAQMAQEWMAQQMASAQNQQPAAEESRVEMLAKEIEAQVALYIDPEVDRIASMFFTHLMTAISLDFRYTEPTWEELGAREKRHWLSATIALLEELKKEPIANNGLSQLAHRRIIQQ